VVSDFQVKIKGTALTGDRLGRDFAVVQFYNFFAVGQTYAAAIISIAGVKALKYQEHLFYISWIDAYTIV